MNPNHHLIKIHKELSQVSPTYCVAKWQQVTIHLATGQTHSCHHPGTHKIPVAELEHNPSALHNTNFKKGLRREMLEGKRPKECDYCWRVEDAPGQHFSDRIKKSADPVWGKPFLESSAQMPWDADVIPAYVEVSFSNVCNFGCAYCSPEISSTLMQETKRHGPIPLSYGHQEHDLTFLKSIGKFPIPHKDPNPYIDAWWKWWPELYPKLKVFRITGGEPLLSKETFRTLDWIIEHPNPELEMAINSNLGVDDKLLEEFLQKCNYIVENKLVKKLKIFTSCDTHGEQAEYIRKGLNYTRWYNNLWNIMLKYPALEVTIMVTFNLLSIPRFEYFLRDILAIRQAAVVKNTESGLRGVMLDFPYLRHPRYLSALIADTSMLVKLARCVDFMKRNISTYNEVTYHNGFYPHEVENLERVYNVAVAEWSMSDENLRARDDFYLYIKETDRRNGTDFCKVFPEIAYYYENAGRYYEEARAKQLADAAASIAVVEEPVAEPEPQTNDN